MVALGRGGRETQTIPRLVSEEARYDRGRGTAHRVALSIFSK